MYIGLYPCKPRVEKKIICSIGQELAHLIKFNLFNFYLSINFLMLRNMNRILHTISMRSFRTHLILHTIIQSWNCKTCHVPVVVVFHYLGEPLTAWEGGLANDKSINHGHGGFSVYPPCSSSSSSSSRLPSRGLPAEERTRRLTLTGHGSTSHGRRSDSWRYVSQACLCARIAGQRLTETYGGCICPEFSCSTPCQIC